MAEQVEMEALDREILAWIASHTADSVLSGQLGAAQVIRRDFMQTGFFIYFEPAAELAAVASGVRPVCPHIDSPDLMDGAGCSLFLKQGRLHYLEVYARGGFMPERLKRYTLRAPNEA